MLGAGCHPGYLNHAVFAPRADLLVGRREVWLSLEVKEVWLRERHPYGGGVGIHGLRVLG